MIPKTYDRLSYMRREKATPHAFRMAPSDWSEVVRLQRRLVDVTGLKITTTDVIRHALHAFVVAETRRLDDEQQRQDEQVSS